MLFVWRVKRCLGHAILINLLFMTFYYHQNHSIDDSLNSENALERLFAVLDKRTGKRWLQILLPKIEEQPDWLKFFYGLWMDVEGITK